jgi:hypothetical protein
VWLLAISGAFGKLMARGGRGGGHLLPCSARGLTVFDLPARGSKTTRYNYNEHALPVAPLSLYIITFSTPAARAGHCSWWGWGRVPIFVGGGLFYIFLELRHSSSARAMMTMESGAPHAENRKKTRPK